MPKFNTILPAADDRELVAKTKRARAVAARRVKSLRQQLKDLRPLRSTQPELLASLDASLHTAEAQHAAASARVLYIESDIVTATRAAQASYASRTARSAPIPALARLEARRASIESQLAALLIQITALEARQDAPAAPRPAKHRATAEAAQARRAARYAAAAARTAEREAAAQARDRAEQDRIDAKMAASIARAALRQPKRTE